MYPCNKIQYGVPRCIMRTWIILLFLLHGNDSLQTENSITHCSTHTLLGEGEKIKISPFHVSTEMNFVNYLTAYQFWWYEIKTSLLTLKIHTITV